MKLKKTKPKIQKTKLKWINFAALTIAGIINAFGVTIFLYPVNLYDSGISGTSMLLAQITPDFLVLSFFLIILNIPIFLFGFKKQGWVFTIYSLFTVVIYSVVSYLITDVLPIDVTIASPLAGTDLLLCALFGGVLSGIGSGLTIRFGGALDGIEVLAVIFAKKIGITVGTFCMMYNAVIYIIAGIILHSWILPLYSIVTYFANLKTVDFIVEGLDRSKAATIITENPDEVCAALSEEFKCGMTRIAAYGGFSGSEIRLIFFVINRFQIGKMKDIVHNLDPRAYITINEVADVFKSNQQSI